jgi:hypothetical protein
MSVGDLSISGGADAWRKKAKSLDLMADTTAIPYAGGITLSDKLVDETDTDRVAPAFTRDQDNIPGGPESGDLEGSPST